MATSHDIRVLALQALYALDMADGREPDAVRSLVDRDEALCDPEEAKGARGVAPSPAPRPDFAPADRRRAFDLAKAAWDARTEADAFFAELAPTWPANRQPVIDRSILRLAWQEMRSGKAPPRVVVSEAIDLARAFSTDKSPAFINALLDKALHALEAPPDDDADLADPAPGGALPHAPLGAEPAPAPARPTES